VGNCLALGVGNYLTFDTYALFPRKHGHSNSFDVSISEEKGVLSWEEQRLWLKEQSERIAEFRPEAAWWAKPGIHQHEIPLFGYLPASILAMYWLYGDLFDLALVSRAPTRYDAFW